MVIRIDIGITIKIYISPYITPYALDTPYIQNTPYITGAFLIAAYSYSSITPLSIHFPSTVLYNAVEYIHLLTGGG